VNPPADLWDVTGRSLPGMNPPPTTADESIAPSSPIPEWEKGVLSVFVDLFETFGLPKSTALIYGTLYCSETPLLQEDLCTRLGISTGSASQGLKLLQSIGAVQRQSPPGQRHSHYTAELSLRRWIGTFLDSHLRPRLQNNRSLLNDLGQNLDPDAAHARQRIQALQSWQQKVESILPLVSGLLGKPSA